MGEPVWMTRDAVEELFAESRSDEWGHGGPEEYLYAAWQQREAMLGECLSRFRLALTSIWLGNGHDGGEAEGIISAAIALLVEHDAIDPNEPVDSDHRDSGGGTP